MVGTRPVLELDHVIVAVNDLAAAAARFERDYGLSSVEGGRHRGLGTGNRIVPLGSSYVELMAIVDEDEARDGALARWLRATTADGDRLGALCLRTDDADAVAQRLGSPVLEMGRLKPDGTELRWKLAGLEQTLADPRLPFFIQWFASPAEQPGATPVEHASGARGIEWVEIACDEAVLRERIGDAAVDVRPVPGDGGLRRVGIATRDGTLVLD
ncbi:MAG TPA: VOC family protein [Actinomycetota bacterium]|nr:VOC family protein [Actinomycetota bacterium]